MDRSLEEMLSDVEQEAKGSELARCSMIPMEPSFALALITSVRSRLSPVQGEEFPELGVTDEDKSVAGGWVDAYDRGSPLGHQQALWEIASLTRQLRSALAEICRLKWELEKEEKAHEQTIGERDDAEDALGDGYVFVTGRVAEWSNLFGYDKATSEMAEFVKDLQDSLSASRADALKEALDAVMAVPARIEVWLPNAENPNNMVRAIDRSPAPVDFANAILARMEKAS